MDYQEFRQRIVPYVVVPSDKQKEKFISAEDTIHFAVTLTKQNESYMQKTMDEFSDFIYILEERGAVSQTDFIVTAQYEEITGGLVIVAHMKKEFCSDEDFDPSYKRYGLRK